jgi:hypothetical protein
MVTDPAYREYVKHRTVGVADSRLIRLAPITPGAALGNSRPPVAGTGWRRAPTRVISSRMASTPARALK